jgi:hypothetical protein
MIAQPNVGISSLFGIVLTGNDLLTKMPGRRCDPLTRCARVS